VNKIIDIITRVIVKKKRIADQIDHKNTTNADTKFSSMAVASVGVSPAWL
jgi:hypothetical protein